LQKECETKYKNWKSILGSFGSNAYVMQGNHDRTGKEKADAVWEKVFSYLPGNGPQGFVKFAYSFDFDNSHFVVLDSDKPKEFLINETQRNWLDQDLSRTRKENIFVFFHEPAYPTNSKIDEGLDTNPKDRDALWNIFVKHKVKAVFSGHEHIQSRRKIDGIYQFIFGNTDSFNHLAPKPGMAEYSYVGPGFGIVEVEGKKITVETFSVQGKILNSFTLPI
jgi:3',5'-cyclic AMP phosphodiesterase CpdA